MKRTIIAAAVVALSGTSAFASSAQEGRIIGMCVEAAEAYAGVYLDEFDADYNKGGFFSDTEVTWPNAKCVPDKAGIIGDVPVPHTLTIEGVEYIVEGYAGRDALYAAKVIEEETDAAIEELKKRISILRNDAYKADKSLSNAGVDAEAVLERARTRIGKALKATKGQDGE